MVPFIDVMLVLLIIFMVTAPLIAPSMIDLPSIGKASKTPDQVIQVVDALQGAAHDYDTDAWYTAWRDLGDHLWQQGEIELAADHPRSARGSFLRACSYYQWAIAYLDHDDPRKGETHRRSIDAFARYAAWCEQPIRQATPAATAALTRTSHGICKPCALQHFGLDLELPSEGQLCA